MNKPENLTEEDIEFFEHHQKYTKERKWGYLKVADGIYDYIDERRKG